MSMEKDFALLAEEGNKEEKKIPIVPIVSGEVFLQDKIANQQQCYICKKDINKYNTKDTVLLRIRKGLMGHCCTEHVGIVGEFIKQFNRLPFEWSVYDKKVKDLDVDSIPEHHTNKYRGGAGKNKKAHKGHS